MNSDILAEEMKTYLNDYKQEIENNKEVARERAKNNLVEMGYIKENLEVLPPYNGEKVNDEDFTFGPGEFQYVKRIKDK